MKSTVQNPELTIEWVDIELVHPNPWNPNVQSDFIYAKTRISILEHGFIDPIKVRQLENGQYEVIDGEHRWKIVNELITQIEQRGKRYYVVEKNGDDEKLYPIKKEIAQGKIPILNYGEISDGVARELTLVLDYTRGEPDELKLAEVIKELDDMLGHDEVERMLPYTGNELEDLMRLLDGDNGGVHEDDPPEVSEEEPVTQTGDLWCLGEHRLLCGDSIEEQDIERVMDGKKAEMVFNDPPFDFPHLDLIPDRLDSIIADTNIFLTCCDKGMVEYLRASPFEFREFFVCDMCFKIHIGYRHGGYCNPYVGHFLISHETIGDPPRCRDLSDGFSSLMRIKYKGKLDDEQFHSHQKPLKETLLFVDHYSIEGNIVVDLFLGAGTTLIATDQLKRICYGIEIEPDYCDVIVKRYINHIGSSENVYVERDGEKLSWEEVNSVKLPHVV